MIWTVLGTIGIVLAAVAWLILREATMGLSTGVLGWLFARGIWQLAGTIENKGLDDPVYKKNLQRLIERNRQFEEARNEPHS